MLTPKSQISGITTVILEPEARQIVQNSETECPRTARIPRLVLARAGAYFPLLLSLVFILGAVIVAGRGGTTRSFCLASVVWLGGPECPASSASPRRATLDQVTAIKVHPNTGKGANATDTSAGAKIPH